MLAVDSPKANALRHKPESVAIPPRQTLSIDNSPIAVVLTARVTVCRRGTPVDPNGLRVPRTAEAVAVLVVIVDPQGSVIAGSVVAPAIVCVPAAGLEPAIVGAIDIAPILAVQTAADAGAYRAAGKCSENGSRATRRAACDRAAQKPARNGADDQAAGLVVGALLLTVAIVGIPIRA